MTSQEAKKSFLEDIAKMASKGENSPEMQLKLHEFLMQNTNGGKLYKYRSFDNQGYSLKNFKEGTLHCSKSHEFNDPFDCKIGITIQSLCEAVYGDAMKMLSVFLQKIVDVISGESQIEDCTGDEQRIIRKLIMNDKITSLASNIDGEQHINLDNLPLEKISMVIAEVIQIILSDSAFHGSFGACSNVIPEVIKKIDMGKLDMVTDYNAIFQKYACAKGFADDMDEVGVMLRLSQELYPENSLNVDNIEKTIDDIERVLTDKIKNLFCIGCLCTDYKNRLMWSHYAEKHKGFCIEYDFSSAEKEVLSKLPFPVYYSKERPLVPWKVALQNTIENREEAYISLMLGILTKDKIWEYENEWRIPMNEKNDVDLKMPRVSCVYLGAAIEKNNRDKIIEIAKKNRIPVKQMIIDRGVYDLHAEQIVI